MTITPLAFMTMYDELEVTRRTTTLERKWAERRDSSRRHGRLLRRGRANFPPPFRLSRPTDKLQALITLTPASTASYYRLQ
jgi:hypothetical protein